MKRIRNIAAVALAAGIALGIWMADWFKGIGFGQRGLDGIMTSVEPSSSGTVAQPAALRSNVPTPEANVATPAEANPTPPQKSISILIEDRSYFLATETGRQQVTLERIRDLARAATGDENGFRIKIARSASSRPTAERELEETLKTAAIPEQAIYWQPGVADEKRE